VPLWLASVTSSFPTDREDGVFRVERLGGDRFDRPRVEMSESMAQNLTYERNPAES